jgi:nucleoid-associated protein YgaU
MSKNEEVVSMFLGLGVVIILVFFIFSFIRRAKGQISVPGVTTELGQLPLTTPTTNNNEEKNVYMVVQGDSLYKIAQAKLGDGNLWVKIANDNKIQNPSVIIEGQKLLLDIKIETKKDVETSNYQIKQRDSLWSIAVANFNNGYKWVDIWNLNKSKIFNPNRLEVGMVIKLR